MILNIVFSCMLLAIYCHADCLLLSMFPWTLIAQTTTANWLNTFIWKEIVYFAKGQHYKKNTSRFLKKFTSKTTQCCNRPSAEIKYYFTHKKSIFAYQIKCEKSIFNTIKDTHQGLRCFILQCILYLQQYLMMIPIPFWVAVCKWISPINWQAGFILQSCWAVTHSMDGNRHPEQELPVRKQIRP